MAAGAPSVGLAIRGLLQNYSGTVAAAAVSQKLIGGNDNWNYIFIQNPANQSESLFLNFDNDADVVANNSMELLPGQSIIFKTPGFITNQQINITAVTMGHPFVCFAN